MWLCAAPSPLLWAPDMSKVEIGAAIFVHGEPRAVGDIVDVDAGTAKYLIDTGKAVAVADEEPPACKPASKPASRRAQSAPATTEE